MALWPGMPPGLFYSQPLRDDWGSTRLKGSEKTGRLFFFLTAEYCSYSKLKVGQNEGLQAECVGRKKSWVIHEHGLN